MNQWSYRSFTCQWHKNCHRHHLHQLHAHLAQPAINKVITATMTCVTSYITNNKNNQCSFLNMSNHKAVKESISINEVNCQFCRNKKSNTEVRNRFNIDLPNYQYQTNSTEDSRLDNSPFFQTLHQWPPASVSKRKKKSSTSSIHNEYIKNSQHSIQEEN